MHGTTEAGAAAQRSKGIFISQLFFASPLRLRAFAVKG